eukprot:jgi/Mesen1/1236/ME000129S00336
MANVLALGQQITSFSSICPVPLRNAPPGECGASCRGALPPTLARSRGFQRSRRQQVVKMYPVSHPLCSSSLSLFLSLALHPRLTASDTYGSARSSALGGRGGLATWQKLSGGGSWKSNSSPHCAQAASCSGEGSRGGGAGASWRRCGICGFCQKPLIGRAASAAGSSPFCFERGRGVSSRVSVAESLPPRSDQEEPHSVPSPSDDNRTLRSVPSLSDEEEPHAQSQTETQTQTQTQTQAHVQSESQIHAQTRIPASLAKAFKGRWENPNRTKEAAQLGKVEQRSAGKPSFRRRGEEAGAAASVPPSPSGEERGPAAARDFKFRWQNPSIARAAPPKPGAREKRSPTGGKKISQLESRRAADEQASRAICQALQAATRASADEDHADGDAPGSGKPVQRGPGFGSGSGGVSLSDVMQPWAQACNKYVLTGVLRELEGDPRTALAFFRWAQAQPWYGAEAVRDLPDQHPEAATDLPARAAPGLQAGAASELRAYTMLLGVCGRAGDFGQVSALLEEMERKKVEPSIVTFNTLLSAYGRAAMWREVEDLRDQMAARGVPTDVFTCRTLVEVYGGAGLFPQAIKTYRAFLATGGAPDTKLYRRAIWAHAKCGDHRGAYQTLREMKAGGCDPDTIDYNTLLGALAKAGRVDVALAVFEEMKQRAQEEQGQGQKQQPHQAEQEQEQEQVQEQEQQQQGQGLGQRQQQQQQQQQRQGQGRGQGQAQVHEVTPDVVTYNTLVTVCGKTGRWREAVRVWHEMEAAGVAPDERTWTTMVHTWGQAGKLELAQEWFDKMTREGEAAGGCRLGVAAYNSLLHTFLKNGWFPEARRVLEQLLARCHVAELGTYTLLLGAHAQYYSEEERGEVWGLLERLGHPLHASLKELLLRGEQPKQQQEEEEEGGGVLPSGADRDVRAEAVANAISNAGALLDDVPADTVEADPDVRAAADALLDGVPAETLERKKEFVNAATNFLWDDGRKEHAFAMWASARSRGLCPLNGAAALQHVALRGRPQALLLDLRSMHLHTARVAALSELVALRQLALAAEAAEHQQQQQEHQQEQQQQHQQEEHEQQPTQQRQPPLFAGGVELVTGRGDRNRAQGKATVKDTIWGMVAAAGLPFVAGDPNSPILKADGEELRRWLLRPEAAEALSFRGAAALYELEDTKEREECDEGEERYELVAPKEKERKDLLLQEEGEGEALLPLEEERGEALEKRGALQERESLERL